MVIIFFFEVLSLKTVNYIVDHPRSRYIDAVGWAWIDVYSMWLRRQNVIGIGSFVNGVGDKCHSSWRGLRETVPLAERADILNIHSITESEQKQFPSSKVSFLPLQLLSLPQLFNTVARWLATTIFGYMENTQRRFDHTSLLVCTGIPSFLFSINSGIPAFLHKVICKLLLRFRWDFSKVF